MKIKQTGATVTARYGSAQTNTITGTVTGKVLRGTWKEGTSTGNLRFNMSADDSSFTGVYGDGAEPPTHDWGGKNVSHAPQPAPGATTTASTPKTTSSPKAVEPASFAGVWTTDYGVMKIKQAGAAITARYGTAQTNTITGTVTGRTLRGKWKEGSSSGNVRFTISTDGTKFKGVYGDGAEPPTHNWNGTKS
jgi:hypothetical protein